MWSRVTTPSTKSLLAYGAEGPAGAAAAALKNVGNAFIAKATAVTGDTPQDILRSMGEAFNELIEAVRDEERAIQDALAELDGFLSGPRNASLLPREIDPAYGVEAPRPYPERRGMPR